LVRALLLIFKIAFFLALLLALVAAAGLWWLNRYIQKPEFVEKVRGAATEAAGAPVDFDQLMFDPLKGFRVENLRILNPESTRQPQALATKNISLDYRLAPLLQRRLEIAEFRLEEPQISLEQNEAGDLVLPKKEPAPPSPETPTPDPGTAIPLPLEVVLSLFTLQNGKIRIQDHAGTAKLQVDGIQANARLDLGTTATQSSGNLKISKIQLRQFTITQIQSPFTLKENILTLSALQGLSYQGQLSGFFDLNTGNASYPYNLKLDAVGMDANQMLGEVAGKSGLMSGKLGFKSVWLGPAKTPLALSGKGSFEITDGQLINIPLFRILGETLKVPAIAQPDFSKIYGDFSVDNQVCTFPGIKIESALLKMDGAGTIDFDLHVNFEIDLALSPDITRQLPQGVENLLTKREDGFRSIRFTVTGTVDRPSTDLPQKLLFGNDPLKPENIQNTLDNLRSLFGPKKSTPSPTPPPPTPTPAPAGQP
jgi:uncharacterized protein involved in outer membrane biogenesis